VWLKSGRSGLDPGILKREVLNISSITTPITPTLGKNGMILVNKKLWLKVFRYEGE